MVEYIEREAALMVLCDACGNAACPKGLIPRCSYYEKMQSIPAADVRPVVHGTWDKGEDYDPYGGGRYVEGSCSECFHIVKRGWAVRDKNSDKKPTENYCPNCGADMREES